MQVTILLTARIVKYSFYQERNGKRAKTNTLIAANSTSLVMPVHSSYQINQLNSQAIATGYHFQSHRDGRRVHGVCHPSRVLRLSAAQNFQGLRFLWNASSGIELLNRFFLT